MSNHEHDREASIDRLLAGAMPRGAADASPACLDEETLAAWADDALSGAERAAAEAHAADCDRCQALLAAMVRVAAASESHGRTAPSFWSRVPRWRWLVPAGAVAAVIVAWVLVPGREQTGAVRQEHRVAESTPPPPQSSLERRADAPPAGNAANRAKTAPEDRQSFAKSTAAASDKNAAAPPNANAFGSIASTDATLDKDRTTAQTAAIAPRAAAAAKASPIAGALAVIMSPDPSSQWQILSTGAVQRSLDGGLTWQTQATGATETLTAGASPSASVCWLVGGGGTVLLSSDGQSWQRLVFPEPTALVAVRAVDDKKATVTAADGRKFATVDGGATWTRPPD